MVLNGQVRITFIVAITLTIFMIAIISVSNPSMFAAAKGGHSIEESQPDIFVMRPGMGGIIPSGSVPSPSMYAVSQPGNAALTQNDNLLNFVGNRNTKWDAINTELSQFVDVGTRLRPASYDANPPYHSISEIRDPSSTITRTNVKPGYMVSNNNIAPVSQVQIENGFYDFQIILEDKLLQSNNLLSYVRGGNHPELIPHDLNILLPTRGENPQVGYSLVNAELGSGRYSPASSSKSFEPFQNIVMRHGGIVQVGYTIDYDGYADFPQYPLNMLGDLKNYKLTSSGDSELQNEEAEFQDNLKDAIIHHGI